MKDLTQKIDMCYESFSDFKNDTLFVTAIKQWDNGEYEFAYKTIEPLYKQNIGRAINFVGMMYELGLHFPKDFNIAFKHYKNAAKTKSLFGIYHLGRAFFDGIGTEINIRKAISAWKTITLLTTPVPQCLQETVYNLGLKFFYDPNLLNDKIGFALLCKAGDEKKNKAFFSSYVVAKRLCNKYITNNKITSKIDVISCIHESMRDDITITDDKIHYNVFKYITQGITNTHNLSLAQIANFLLILAHVLYLRDEAPRNEQNIIMLVELLEAGINDWIKSDTDRLYEMLKENKKNHRALKIYNLFHALTQLTPNNFSYSSQVAKNSRELFSQVGSSKNIFRNHTTSADVAELANILAYSFLTDGVDNLKNWTSCNMCDLTTFQIELVTNFIKRNENTNNISYVDLANNNPIIFSEFSLSVIQKCIDFYNAF